MLAWLFGSRADHPLADVKRARALIAELSADDNMQQTLNEIARWLQSLCEAEGVTLDRLAEVIALLDASAKNHQRKMVREYIALSRQQKIQESKLWACGFNFAKVLGESYLLCVRQHRKNAPGASAIGKQIPVLAARALRAMGMQLKWIMLRYGPFDPRLWRSIGELYGHAEEGGFTSTTLQIYPGAHGTGTIDEEYLKIMMLWASSVDMLLPLKQEVAERLVAQFAGAFRTEKQPSAGAMYWFDHAGDKPPARLMGSTAAGTDVHYFGPGDARSSILEIAAVIEKTGEVPSTVILSGIYPPQIVLAVLRHLSVYWSGTPPARTSERKATTARIAVVIGYATLLDTLVHEHGDALNFSAMSAENWAVENISHNGYGALVSATTGDWTRVGELIGIRLEGFTEWGVGLVRRVARDQNRQYHVGIEVISRSVVPVKLFHGQAGHEPEHAILLSTHPGSNTEMEVLMRAGRYDPQSPMKVAGPKHSYLLSPARMVDAGGDFDWAIYTITRRD